MISNFSQAGTATGRKPARTLEVLAMNKFTP